ncbi:hypothetical protein, partial [Phormidium sp. CCY1219]|uniref:hypothetical protein n=1 Tax=Phormidium sp. CCY1219 TaxID=2886104 RepID=UPI002D1E96C5
MNPEDMIDETGTVTEQTTEEPQETTTVTEAPAEEQQDTAQPLTVELTNFTGDNAQAKLLLEQTDTGIQVNVVDVTPQADIRGVFLNIADDSLLGGLTVNGSDVTNSAIGSANQGNLSGDANVTPSSFEVGVEIGTQGMGADDISSTSFTLSHASETLKLESFLSQNFGLRLTSVGEENRSGSSKLEGIAPASLTPEVTEEESETAEEETVMEAEMTEEESETAEEETVMEEEMTEEESETAEEET